MARSRAETIHELDKEVDNIDTTEERRGGEKLGGNLQIGQLVGRNQNYSMRRPKSTFLSQIPAKVPRLLTSWRRKTIIFRALASFSGQFFEKAQRLKVGLSWT